MIAILIVLISGCQSLNLPRSNYSDNCDYSSTHGDFYYDQNYYRCGDICVRKSQKCICGDWVIFQPFFNVAYCCTPPEVKCMKTEAGVECPQGEKQSQDTEPMCHGRCYNDYLTSQYIGLMSHYTCPDTCIEVLLNPEKGDISEVIGDMCQGVSFCEGDEKICGEDLRCGSEVDKHNISTVPARSYCLHIRQNTQSGEVGGDYAYDLIDRGDEEVRDKAARTNINYTALTTCTNYAATAMDPGVKCDSNCMISNRWCLGERDLYCEDQGGVSMIDPFLCSNHTFWQNISCDATLLMIHPQELKGKRCTGKKQHCIYPELAYVSSLQNASHALEAFPLTCEDYSDRIFEVEQPCPDSAMDICWESCDSPGVNCTACTSTEYFQCPQSKQCVHPKLHCDGHPQCQFGEDEDLDVCGKIYHVDKVTMPYATFRCKSIMYPTMETYAITCDDFPECDGYTDEKFCSEDSVSSTILISSVIVIALIYLVLKSWHLIFQKKIPQSQVSKKKFRRKKILKLYSKDHGNEEVIKKVNCLLLHTILSEPSAETESICLKMYAILEKIHRNDIRQIFSCLHQDFDPLIMQNIVSNQFPGIAKKTLNKIEDFVIYPFFTRFSDLINVNIIKSTISRLIKIELEYLDILKDTILAITIHRIIGGYQAILSFPDNFSVVVDLCLFATVIIPLFFATLHLVIHNPYMIFNLNLSTKIKKSWKKILLSLTCCLLSVFNPILLINAYEAAKEKFRKMAKTLDDKMILQLKNANKIKDQWAFFVNIELGKYFLVFFFSISYQN